MSEVQNLLDHALTAEELIEQLKQLPGEARVLFVCDYGDYCHTQQALQVETVEEVDATQFGTSAYSQSKLEHTEAADHDDETYCEKCDSFHAGVVQCPKCGGDLVDEDGETVTTVAGNGAPVIILK